MREEWNRILHSMIIDIVVATYNRPGRASKTVQEFLNFKNRFFSNVIIVDSSDGLGISDYPQDPDVVYLRSSHKNQPFQRYLGFRYSQADVILFLDDDLHLVDPDTLYSQLLTLEDEHLVGISFASTGGNEFVESVPKSVFPQKINQLTRGLKWLSGSPELQPGKVWLCGLRGVRKDQESVEYVGGANGFALRRKSTFLNFNFALLDFMELRIGAGEDLIIGFTASRIGRITAVNEPVFFHDHQNNSIYSSDYFRFSQNVSFSRLYLSLEYARLTCMNSNIALLHYHWYMICRLLVMLFSSIIQPSLKRWDGLRGWLSGWMKAAFWKPRPLAIAEEYWRAEAEKDLTNFS